MAPLIFLHFFKFFVIIIIENKKEVISMIWEFIIVVWNEMDKRKERKYGLVFGEDEESALAKLGYWYGDTVIRLEYFGSPVQDADDRIYEFNDDYANNFNVTGRKFKKIIPELNDISEDDKIYE